MVLLGGFLSKNVNPVEKRNEVNILSLEETKLVGLTMKLNLKDREYKILRKHFEELKDSSIYPNDKQFAIMLEPFRKILAEIKEINKLLNEIGE